MISNHPRLAACGAYYFGIYLKDRGDVDAAAEAFWHTILFQHPEFSAFAALQLGLIYQQENVESAIDFYGLVIAFDNPKAAPQAECNLGKLLESQGDTAGAKEHYSNAINSDWVEAVAKAAWNLGKILEKEGDLAGAVKAYETATGTQYPGVSEWADKDLARLLGDNPAAT
jgi:tetratricopeptide (TPR) repeat protein